MRFYSKRNEVTLFNNIVLKRFSDTTACARELLTVRKLTESYVAVPKILNYTENSIQYEYICSRTYAELVDCFSSNHALALVNWLSDYYSATSTLRGDVNLRNFLFCNSDGTCVGVDFEDECFSGEKESDYGRILAFALTYDPAFCAKKLNCARALLDAFCTDGANIDRIVYFYSNEIEQMQKRRQSTDFNLAQAQEFIKEIVDEIKA